MATPENADNTGPLGTNPAKETTENPTMPVTKENAKNDGVAENTAAGTPGNAEPSVLESETENAPKTSVPDENEIIDLEDNTVSPTPNAHSPTEMVVKRNVFQWELRSTGQVLPVVSIIAPEPDKKDKLSYTAWVLNKLACDSDGEDSVWDMLGSGDLHIIVRIIELHELWVDSSGKTYFSRLELSCPHARTVIAAHVKLDATNEGVPCSSCAKRNGCRPFKFCIATSEFRGSCTNCEYYAKGVECSLRRPSYNDEAPRSAVVERGTKRPRTEQVDPQVRARSRQHNQHENGEDDFVSAGFQPERDRSARRTCLIPWHTLEDWEVQALVSEGKNELTRRSLD